MLLIVDSDLVENEEVVPLSHLTENVEPQIIEQYAHVVSIVPANEDNVQAFTAGESVTGQFQDNAQYIVKQICKHIKEFDLTFMLACFAPI